MLNAVGWSDALMAQEAIAAGEQLAQDLTQSPREHLGRCVGAVEVGPSLVRIALDLVGCEMVPAGSAQQQAQIEVAAERKRCGIAVRLVVAGPQGTCARGPDPTLVELLNRARDWLERLTQHGQGAQPVANVSHTNTPRLRPFSAWVHRPRHEPLVRICCSGSPAPQSNGHVDNLRSPATDKRRQLALAPRNR